jgi:hypothetical protein
MRHLPLPLPLPFSVAFGSLASLLLLASLAPAWAGAASPPGALPPAAAPAAGRDGIEVWRKEPGSTKGRLEVRTIRWQELTLEEVTRDDLQLGARRTFRGAPLKAFLFAAPTTALEDTALLHFRNGAQIPVPLKAEVLDRLNAFVAREVRDPESGRFTGDLGKLVHERAPWMEQRAIVFSGNKLVVSGPWHPSVGATTTKFSPWAHVDTLVGIEMVSGEAWERQLRVDEDPRALQGLGTYLARCQFCHGVRERGASLGWDFVKPVPLHTWRAPESLLYHVKLKKLDGAERGLLMPPQPDAEIDEIRALWTWMQAVGRRELRPYQP